MKNIMRNCENLHSSKHINIASNGKYFHTLNSPGWGDRWTEWARGGANGGAIYGGAYSQLRPVIKAFTSVGHRILMELLAREQGTASQSIKLSALMLAAMVYVFISLIGPPIMHSNLIQQSKHRCAQGIALALIMPRARGRPRRGAGWYAADARKKRHQRFARAMLLAKEKRRGGATTSNSLPRTYVEEDLSIALPLDFSESRLFVVPDNWDPPASFGHTTPAPNLGDSPTPTNAPSAEFEACPVEEELPERIAAPQTQRTTPGYKKMEAEEALSECPADMQKQRTTPGQKDAEVERKSPPSPPFLHPEHLNLIFEVRSLVEDQIFRVVRVSQRLDMLYAAYSKATPRRQCPTCAQPFVIPVNGGDSD
jgi:hypothetical protein